MSSRNDITGDRIATKGATTDAYRDSWERIFGKNKTQQKASSDDIPAYVTKSEDDLNNYIDYLEEKFPDDNEKGEV